MLVGLPAVIPGAALQHSEIRRIAILVYPGIQLLDAVGPLEVFCAANRILAGRDPQSSTPYVVEVWAKETGIVQGDSGVSLSASHSFEQHGVPSDLDTLLVAGGPSLPPPFGQPACVKWIAEIAPHVRRVVGICTGAFLLAEAGLLDGRRAVTHWNACAQFSKRFPAVTVETDPIFVRDGSIFTSAGVTAGMDLALALVQDDLGRDLALAVARLLVMFLKRPGGQSQFSAHLEAQIEGASPIERIQRWILENLAENLTVECLADRAAMSPRNFARAFVKKVGTTPASFVERARMDAARRLLEDTDDRVETIAARCGYQSGETLRRVFQRQFGICPSDHRTRFRSAA